MSMVNDGPLNGRHKDGRQIPGKGHRLGWVTNEMYEAIKAQLAPGQSVSDFVIAAIEAKTKPQITLEMFTNYNEILSEMRWIENFEQETIGGIGIRKDPSALKWQALDKQRKELCAAIEAALVNDKES